MAPMVRDGDGSPLQGHQVSLSQGHEGQLSSVCVCGGGLSLKILFVSFHASLYRVLSAPSPTPALGFSMVLFSSNNSVTPFL